MSVTYIAFIECVLVNPNWRNLTGYPHLDALTSNARYEATLDNSEVHVVQIDELRRSFAFKNGAQVGIINNVVVFESDDSEELAVDESKQFPKKKRIDE